MTDNIKPKLTRDEAAKRFFAEVKRIDEEREAKVEAAMARFRQEYGEADE